MRIGITTFGCDGGRSGIGRYAVSLIQAMNALATNDELELISFVDEVEVFLPQERPPGVVRVPTWLRGPVREVAWHQLLWPIAQARHYDVLFLPALNRRVSSFLPCPAVGTLHDLASFRVEAKYDPARRFNNTVVMPFLMRRIPHILTVSESTKHDIVRYVRVPAERIHVTPLGVDTKRFREQDRAAARRSVSARYALDAPYILYVARLEHPGKNHVRLIEAHAQLAARGFPHYLLLAGSDWTRAEAVHQAAASSPAASRVKLLGFVPDTDLPVLYAGAELLAFPSLFEGFGLPLLEAMASRTPVCCSNVSSMPEVAGDAALLFDPMDPGAIADRMAEVIGDENLRARLVAAGRHRIDLFTWERTARATLDVLSLAAGGRGTTRKG